jgi:hypothetical protein
MSKISSRMHGTLGTRGNFHGCVLFVPVLFMWNVVVLLLMHLLGAADCVVASYVFVIETCV